MNSREKEVNQALIKNEQIIIKQLKQVYSKALSDIDDKLEQLIARTDVENIQSIIYQADYQRALRGQVNGILDTLNSNQFEKISDYLTKSYEDGFIGALYNIQGQGIPLIIPIDQEQIVNALTTKSKLSKSLYESLGEDITLLKNRIRANVSRGIASNMSYADIARNIANSSNIGMNNAFRIARTEGHRIQNQSAMDAANQAKEKGADVVKQWDASLDKRTRASHRQLDGQTREIDEPFEINGYKAMQPGGFGIPSLDINCRCALLQRARWTLDEDDLKVLKERAEYYELDKTSNFEDFKKKYKNASDDLTNTQNSGNSKLGKEFTPATTIEEAEEYAKNVLEIPTVSYKDIDVNVANAMNESFYDTIKYNPNTRNYLHAVGSAQEIKNAMRLDIQEFWFKELKKINPGVSDERLIKEAYNQSSIFVREIRSDTYAIARKGAIIGYPEDLNAILEKYKGVSVNSLWGKNYNIFLESVTEGVEKKFHPIGTDTVKSIFDHECGHILDYTLGLRDMPEIKEIYDKYLDEGIQKLTEDLSKYAWNNTNKNKYAEMIAEAYSEYKNNANPREIASTIGKIIDRLTKGGKQ